MDVPPGLFLRITGVGMTSSDDVDVVVAVDMLDVDIIDTAIIDDSFTYNLNRKWSCQEFRVSVFLGNIELDTMQVSAEKYGSVDVVVSMTAVKDYIMDYSATPNHYIVLRD
jgi:hypothetical protein